MPKFDLSVPHTLGQDEALNRLQGFSEKIQEKYSDQVSDFRQEWVENRLEFGFKTFGVAIDGQLEVAPDKVDVFGSLPITAAMFKGQIVGAIGEQLERLLK